MQGMVHRARLAKNGGSKLVYVDPCMHMQLGSVHKSKEGRIVTRTFIREPPLLCSWECTGLSQGVRFRVPACPQCSVRKMQLGKHAHIIPDYFYWHTVKALWKDSLSPESTVTVLFCLRTNCLLSDGAILVLRHFGFKSLGSPVGLDGPYLQPQTFRGWETRINNSYLSLIQTGSRAGWAVWDCVSVCIFVVQWKDYKIWLWGLSKISRVMSLHLRS